MGIDLGTTHTVVAYADLRAASAIHQFAIDQLIAPGAVAKLDKSIAQLADGRLDKACDIFGVAIG